MKYKLAVLLCCFGLLAKAPAADVVLEITEFMAANAGPLTDEDGETSDWIEIHNASASVANLAGWYLTDDTNNLVQWSFPATNLPANGYIIVFASNKDRRVPGAPLHTNFRLSSSGEYLGLIKPDGVTIAFEYVPKYPIQVNGVSYGVPLQQLTTTLLTTGAAVKVLIPPDGLLDTAWTMDTFNDASWISATNGVGYETDGLVLFTPMTIADSVSEFSGTQGQANWSYGYWNKKTDGDGLYNPFAEFVPFPNDGGPHSATNFWTGSAWDWYEGNPPWTELSATGGHPAGDNGVPEQPIHWAIRRYVCETNGPVKITGTVQHSSGWIYTTATGVAANSLIYLYLTGVGDGYIDDIKLVAGATPEAGANLMLNGDFESGVVAPWTVSANHAGSSVTTAAAHSGTRSLRMVTTVGGTTQASSIWQSIAPILAVGQTYTLSYWFLPGTNYSPLVARFSGDWIRTTPSPCGDGSIARIFVDGVQVFQRTAFVNSLNYSVTAPAIPGSLIDFVIEPGAANNDFCDATTFTANIQTQDPTIGLLADSVADWSFSGTQGEKNWLYGYYNRTTDPGGVYQSTNFTLFPRNNGPHSANNYWTGSAWDWFNGNPPWDEIQQLYMHPNGVNNAAEHWTIRRWISESAGNLTVQWALAKQNPAGGGVTGRVFRNGTQMDSAAIGGADVVGVNRTLTLTNVQVGDAIDFALDPNGPGGTDDGSDGSYLSATITGPVGLAAHIATDLTAAMKDINATAYLRLPFEVADPATVNFLTVRLKYDDGFIAYLNGVAVANRNAPISPVYNSAATASRADADAAQFEEFDISSFTGLLHPGTNVLAIHGLNASAVDSDFLIAAELRAVNVLAVASAVRYFGVPTPGQVNGFGNTNLGPVIRDLSHTPNVPLDNQDIVVTARVSPTFNPIGNVRLIYRIMFNAEVTVTMFDDGAHGDGAAANGVFGASIPASASTPGQMVRYYVSALDSLGNASRLPAFENPVGSPQYLGTVVHLPQTNNLPMLHWFIQTPGQADTLAGGRGSIFYKGQFRDNVLAYLHGQSSQGFPKKSYNFDLNAGETLDVIEGAPKVDDFNLLSTWADKSHMRNMLDYDTYTDSGTPAHFSFAVRVQQNGVFFSVANFVENGDDNYLQRIGYDQNGALYKMYNSAESATSGVEKKTRKTEGNGDLAALIAGSSQGDPVARKNYIHDNMDLPEIVNFLAVKSITSDHDCCHKNYYFYRDSDITGEWQALSWDADLSFGRIWSGGPTYFDDANYTNASWNVGGNTVMGSIFNTTSTRQMYYRRIRTLSDQFLGPVGTTNGYYEQRIEQQKALIGPDAALDLIRWGTWGITMTQTQNANQIKTNYLPGRRVYVTATQGAPTGEVPAAQPTNALVQIVGFDFNPVSANQQQEFICLTNPNTYAVDISGWQLGGGVSFTFRGGTVIPPNTVIYATPNKVAFRARATGPRAGQGLLIVGPYDGQLSARGESVTLTDNRGRAVTTNSYAGAPSLAQQYLRITEIMYHPDAPPTNSAYGPEEFEYIELKNIGPVALDLNGVRFTNGIEFSFSGSAITNLEAGQSLLVVKNPAAFAERYGALTNIAGAYVGSLENKGEKLRLEDAVGEEILEFSYDNNWHPITDGHGFSLVIVNENAAFDTWGLKASWRPSGSPSGSPGQMETPPTVPAGIRINEVLTHTDPPQVDAIELYNPTGGDVNVGGWFLTDDLFEEKKFRIPDNTVILAGNYLVFTETNFNPNPGVPPSFSLSSKGDEVFLFSGDASTNLTGYFHGYTFGAAANGVSFGPYVTSVAEEHFVALASLTLGATNSGPKVGPLVVSEIMYHPPDTGANDNTLDEFIEVQNISGGNVTLYPINGTNGWELRDAVSFVFRTNLVVPADGYVLVVSFDPVAYPTQLDAFRTRYNVPLTIPVVGPYAGKLDNSSDSVELYRPDSPEVGEVPYVLIDKVAYKDVTPWPALADGFGPSLQRKSHGQYGNDPANWTFGIPSPGGALPGGSFAPPTITTQPAGQNVLQGASVTLSVNVTGGAPFVYQWRFNGLAIDGATGSSLSLPNLQTSQSGAYSVLVYNNGGLALSSNAFVYVTLPPSFVTLPTNATPRLGSNVTFSVSVSSANLPLTYQWLFNGNYLLNATNASLLRTNVQLIHEGDYSVIVTDSLGATNMAGATLAVYILPALIQPHLGLTATQSPTTNLTVLQGETVTFTIGASGRPLPLSYRWRKSPGGITLTNMILSATNASLILANVHPTNSGTYNVAVTNVAGTTTPQLSGTVQLTVVADNDRDLIPDDWERQYRFDTNSMTDASADFDLDGMSNYAEYLAGTNPTNSLSYLRIDAAPFGGVPPTALLLTLSAVSNHTYSIICRDDVSTGAWVRLADIDLRPTNRVVFVTNQLPVGVTNRFYRLQTPRLP